MKGMGYVKLIIDQMIIFGSFHCLKAALMWKFSFVVLEPSRSARDLATSISASVNQRAAVESAGSHQ